MKGGELSLMVVVTRKKGESTDKVLRKFTKMFREEDIMFDFNKKTFFKKPSLLKKEKQREKVRKEKRYG